MRKLKILSILFIFILISSCNKNDGDFNTTTIDIIQIGKGDLSGSENIPQQNLNITDNESWIQLKNQLDLVNSITPSFTETEIDFTKFQIIAIFDDIKSNGGYSIDISVIENESYINVNIIHTTPQGNVTTVITQPYIIIKIPTNTKPIIFE